ncbi:MAG: hydroxymethylpyrimidine/phosphomethylpyrimidine kinase, partial [Methanobacteriaceae archaeon]|nr:hydroxymethylpyrimidine/phosphomethylpyrimidine kinase [Methanobacteriaceae archaeon]
KTGMLYSPDIVRTVADKVKEYELQLVVDPVITAGSGDILSGEGYVDALKKKLLPLALLATPNIHEAQSISGVTIDNEEDAIEAALKIGKYCNVVVTGGHLKGNDVYYDGSVEVFKGELLETENTHGSGCTYSAAITAYLVKGNSLKDSIKKAGIFTKNSIKHGGNGTLNQFWQI